MLVQHGADIFVADEEGLTPLDVAKNKAIKLTLRQAWLSSSNNTRGNTDTPAEARNTEKGVEHNPSVSVVVWCLNVIYAVWMFIWMCVRTCVYVCTYMFAEYGISVSTGCKYVRFECMHIGEFMCIGLCIYAMLLCMFAIFGIGCKRLFRLSMYVFHFFQSL